MLKSIPQLNDIVISICDDGSKDNTYQIIKTHKERIAITYKYQNNKGRASALRESILNCDAKFLMLVDSDDYFEKKGIQNIYKFINENSSIKFFVFPTRIKKNQKFINISLSGIPKTSYISLRSDYRIKYDLQEVIQKKLLLKILYDDPGKIRRIPTIYLWFKASQKEKCMPVHINPVKVKEYLSDGMSKNLLPLKVYYPEYLVKIYKIALDSKDYESLLYRLKCKFLFYRYNFHNKNLKLSKIKDLPFYFAGFIFGFSDIIRLTIFLKKIVVLKSKLNSNEYSKQNLIFTYSTRKKERSSFIIYDFNYGYIRRSWSCIYNAIYSSSYKSTNSRK